MSATTHYCETNEQGVKANYCPFGCEEADLDDYGHCRHLVGYSDDFEGRFLLGNKAVKALPSDCKKTYEAVAPQVRRSFTTGKTFDTGFKTVFGGSKGRARQPIKVGDVLVNPQRWLEADQHQAIPAHWSSRWVSARVYRQDANNPLAYHRTDDDAFDLPEGHRELLQVTHPMPAMSAPFHEPSHDAAERATEGPLSLILEKLEDLSDQVEQVALRVHDLENAQTTPRSADEVPEVPEVPEETSTLLPN